MNLSDVNLQRNLDLQTFNRLNSMKLPCHTKIKDMQSSQKLYFQMKLQFLWGNTKDSKTYLEL
jgi:hypothetical protein